ncbi:unnamed protein product [Prorocentrum cordatum]|uniref:Ubiquitin-like domain-containing protein n=1 Tax=Prorocentrum cordatum TaxID=2364126 RepID=A0ABN9W9X9_9DINO|nr:unnamed protein product [Polarella glacialis]
MAVSWLASGGGPAAAEAEEKEAAHPGGVCQRGPARPEPDMAAVVDQLRGAQERIERLGAPWVLVTVASVAGEVLGLHLPGGSLGSQVKEAISASSWRVPVACQRLLLPGGPLADGDPIAGHLPPGAAELGVTMAVSLEGVCEELQSAPANGRLRALADLGRLGPRRGGAAAAAAACACLADSDARVREAALAALRELAEGDSALVLPRLCASLRDDAGPGARRAALAALARLGRRGDGRLVRAVGAALDDWDEGVQAAAVHVRLAALGALGQLSRGGGGEVCAGSATG